MKLKRYRVVDRQKWDRAKSTLFIVLVVVTFMVMMYDNGHGEQMGVSTWALVPLVLSGLLAWNLFIKEGKQK
jgi:hypothetical protein